MRPQKATKRIRTNMSVQQTLRREYIGFLDLLSSTSCKIIENELCKLILIKAARFDLKTVDYLRGIQYCALCTSLF